ncbi:MAG: hypothetical protein Q9220_005033 [cf. Caloplaca sp. 1 TL-2023]
MSTNFKGKPPDGALAILQFQGGSVEALASPKASGRRRSTQSKTSYQLAHPPPATKHRPRLRLHSKTLLQLQQLSSTARPVPIINVLPSILFAPRLARKSPHIFHGRQGLGLHDLLITQSRDRSPSNVAPKGSSHYHNEDDSMDHKVIAAICQLHPIHDHGQSHTEIRFDQGSTWSATVLRSGAYEFVSHGPNEMRSLARWVPKRETSISDKQEAQPISPKFKFSVIDTRQRRHPVIANMSPQSIDVNDRYSIPGSPNLTRTSSDTESIRSIRSFMGGGYDIVGDEDISKTTVETDDELRAFILVTGIWVAFCEGWSPNFRYSPKQVVPNGVSELSSLRQQSVAQPASSVAEPINRPLRPVSEYRRRSALIRMSSLASIPSSRSSVSPVTFSRRPMSTSTTLFADNGNRRHTCYSMDSGTDSIFADQGSDLEHEVPKGAPIPILETGAINGHARRSHDAVSNRTTGTSLGDRASSVQRGRSPPITKPKNVDIVVKKPGMFKRFLSHFKGKKTKRGH